MASGGLASDPNPDFKIIPPKNNLQDIPDRAFFGGD